MSDRILLERARLRSTVAALRQSLEAAAADNVRLRSENARLLAERTALINRMSSEAFRIKHASGCYDACTMVRIRIP